jgi:F-type H+-transporting ATPase subunit delta
MEQLNTVARPYAKAAFEFAVENKKIPFWFDWLQSAAVIVSDPQVEKILIDPNISIEQILNLLFSLLEKKLDEHGKNFLRLLATYRRLQALPEIAKLFSKFRGDYEKTADVRVVTAFDLTEEQEKKLTEALHKKLQRKIKLFCEVDKSILGGAIVHAGNLVIDGSGRKKLEQLRNCIENKSN